MYLLHIANKNYSSWSLRPWLLMRVRGIAFEERTTPFASGSNREIFRRFSPNGQVPCLHDGGEVIWESLAIAEYLAERHRGVWPDDPRARAFARCAAAEMHAGFATLRNRCTMNVGLRVRLRDMPDALVRDVDRIGELWGHGLAQFGGPFLAGADFTAVDAFFAPVAFRVQTYGLTLPAAAAGYAQRLLALPAMIAWEQAALRETWREPGHEEDVRQTGTIIEDRRAPPS
jgi:glutathione S-transferase